MVISRFSITRFLCSSISSPCSAALSGNVHQLEHEVLHMLQHVYLFQHGPPSDTAWISAPPQSSSWTSRKCLLHCGFPRKCLLQALSSSSLSNLCAQSYFSHFSPHSSPPAHHAHLMPTTTISPPLTHRFSLHKALSQATSVPSLKSVTLRPKQADLLSFSQGR